LSFFGATAHIVDFEAYDRFADGRLHFAFGSHHYAMQLSIGLQRTSLPTASSGMLSGKNPFKSLVWPPELPIKKNDVNDSKPIDFQLSMKDEVVWYCPLN
jgi:hypothetical protein